ncbi:hypothetical protein HYDPIDRAFT_31140 [Hydnomerulius pinastri MD-312]|uniref:DUF4470 domain-containing protein n=1 Tax=Hydnomerulius pinastri MD-312 TaxID=994086 RepID=A0A0C9VU40_9AGAM|nr:hypothetical protein HYDPIDRAFT_31140 [Hydnomerulius pinastri MD-312]
MDIINLKNNERDKNRDFSLAFIGVSTPHATYILSDPGSYPASGSLQHVVRTVNALGPDYSGRLDILLNDVSHPIVSRNIVLLLILGAVPNEAIAANMAIHFWFSAFLPSAYRLRILATLVSVLQQADAEAPLTVNLGRLSKLTCLVPQEITGRLLYAAGPTVSTEDAEDAYHRMRAAPDRLDSRDRMYVGLKSSHRLAFLEFRRSGIVLPFGATRTHFTAPNVSLFSPFGKWLQNDEADPLASWDPDNVIKSGQAHGANPEDIYGCLYFYLSDQLRTFARHIRDLNISFHVFSTDPRVLAKEISTGTYSMYGLSPSMRFNRIDVSNTLDAGHIGNQDVLRLWAPLLAEGNDAAIVGSFKNWADVQEKGHAEGAGDEVVAKINDRLTKTGRALRGAASTPMKTGQMDILYDNSKEFSKFLKNQGIKDVLRETKLKLRQRHKIIPHRAKTQVEGKTGDLPHLPDDETWYRYVSGPSPAARVADAQHTLGRHGLSVGRGPNVTLRSLAPRYEPNSELRLLEYGGQSAKAL